jgi:hypothetical protein
VYKTDHAKWEISKVNCSKLKTLDAGKAWCSCGYYNWDAVFVAVNGWIRGTMARKGPDWGGLNAVVNELAPLIRWGFLYASLLDTLVRNVRTLHLIAFGSLHSSVNPVSSITYSLT